ncbi:MAG TPA: hypothetical protein VI548_05755 [Chitinophagaceae bacterium]|nr:hypothetical protein [Chitinophagaceae bacterium]
MKKKSVRSQPTPIESSLLVVSTALVRTGTGGPPVEGMKSL